MSYWVPPQDGDERGDLCVLTAYEDSTAKANDGCPTAHLFVYTTEAPGADPRELAAALARGWADDGKLSPLRQLGPQPDIWLPDSTLDVDAVQDNARKSAALSPITAQPASIASSPIVLGWLDSTTPASSRVTWAQLLARPDVQKAGLYRPHPDGSATGRLATLVMYASQAGATAERQLEQRIGVTFSQRGIPQQGASGSALLCLARSGVLGGSGVIIAAKDAWSRYDNGLPLSADCGTRIEPLGGVTGQVVQPTDTVVLDHPFVSLTWTRSPRLTAARDAVLQWLLSPPGQQALREQGMDAPTRAPTTWPTLSVLDKALRQYHATKLPAHVLLAVDASGSMDEKVAGGTRFDVVRHGVQDSLDQMGTQDSLTLWTFSGQAHQTLVSQVRGDYTGRRQVIAALSTVPRSGATPLYPTITDAVTAAGTVVVLTDGEDTTGMPASKVAALVRESNTQLYVVAVGEARCRTGPLLQIAGKRCYQADFGNVDRQLADLFGALWKGN